MFGYLSSNDKQVRKSKKHEKVLRNLPCEDCQKRKRRCTHNGEERPVVNEDDSVSRAVGGLSLNATSLPSGFQESAPESTFPGSTDHFATHDTQYGQYPYERRGGASLQDPARHSSYTNPISGANQDWSRDQAYHIDRGTSAYFQPSLPQQSPYSQGFGSQNENRRELSQTDRTASAHAQEDYQAWRDGAYTQNLPTKPEAMLTMEDTSFDPSSKYLASFDSSKNYLGDKAKNPCTSRSFPEPHSFVDYYGAPGVRADGRPPSPHAVENFEAWQEQLIGSEPWITHKSKHFTPKDVPAEASQSQKIEGWEYRTSKNFTREAEDPSSSGGFVRKDLIGAQPWKTHKSKHFTPKDVPAEASQSQKIEGWEIQTSEDFKREAARAEAPSSSGGSKSPAYHAERREREMEQERRDQPRKSKGRKPGDGDKQKGSKSKDNQPAEKKAKKPKNPELWRMETLETFNQKAARAEAPSSSERSKLPTYHEERREDEIEQERRDQPGKSQGKKSGDGGKSAKSKARKPKHAEQDPAGQYSYTDPISGAKQSSGPGPAYQINRNTDAYYQPPTLPQSPYVSPYPPVPPPRHGSNPQAHETAKDKENKGKKSGGGGKPKDGKSKDDTQGRGRRRRDGK